MNRRSPPDGEPRLHLWPAPNVHLQSPPQAGIYGRAENPGTPKPCRLRRRSRSGQHGSRAKREANGGGRPDQGYWSRPRRRCKLDKKVLSAPSARQHQTGRRIFSRHHVSSARDRHPDGTKPRLRVRWQRHRARPAWPGQYSECLIAITISSEFEDYALAMLTAIPASGVGFEPQLHVF